MSKTKETAATKEAKEVKFRAVYFLPTLEMHKPECMVVRFMVDKGEAGVSDGDKVRLYPKKEATKDGWQAGIWGENVNDHKACIAAWALGVITHKFEEASELVASLGEAEQNWTEFLATQ